MKVYYYITDDGETLEGSISSSFLLEYKSLYDKLIYLGYDNGANGVYQDFVQKLGDKDVAEWLILIDIEEHDGFYRASKGEAVCGGSGQNIGVIGPTADQARRFHREVVSY